MDDIKVTKNQAEILVKLITKESESGNDVFRKRREAKSLIKYITKNLSVPYGQWFTIYDIIGTWATGEDIKTVLPVFDECKNECGLEVGSDAKDLQKEYK